MTRETIKKRLEALRKQSESLRAKEQELVDMLQEADDAANMKIIRKNRISPEHLQFLNGLKEEEIAMILRKREKEKSAPQEGKEGKAADHGKCDGKDSGGGVGSGGVTSDTGRDGDTEQGWDQG